MLKAIGQYAVAAAVFGVLDFVWLGTVARPLYDSQMGDLLAVKPNVAAALAFYVIYVFGITWFATRPALAEESSRRALISGGVLGFVAYATWDLTSLAVIEGFPASIVAVDMAWGTVATALTAVATYAVCRKVPALR